MKYYVLKLPHINGKHQYPANYEAGFGSVSVDHVYYDDEIDGEFSLLLAIPDEKAPSIPLPQRVVEIQEKEAQEIADKYEPRTNIIVNEAVVRQLEIKSRIGIELSKDDLDALDSTKDIGFGISKNFNDRIEKIKLIKK